MVCSDIGCPHPNRLDLDYSELIDWEAYWHIKMGVEDPKQATNAMQEMADFDAQFVD